MSTTRPAVRLNVSMAEDRGLVVIVEDERSISDLQRLYLTQAGFGVHVAADGDTGLADIRRLAPVAAVIDIGLPGLDGTEVVRRLRAEQNWVPIVFVTAQDSEIDRVVGLELGCRRLPDQALLTARTGRAGARPGAAIAVDRRPPIRVARIEHARVSLDTGARRARVDGTEVELTTTEFDLLAHLIVASAAGLHPRAAALGGLGRRRLRADPHRRRARRPVASEAGRSRPDPHRARCRVRDGRGVAG